MAIKVQDILNEVAGEIQDPNKVRTTNSKLLEFFNTALLQVVLVRPDANAKTKSISLVAGTKQDLPDGDLRLLDVTRNMGATGSTAGNAILQGDMDTQNRYNPAWHTAAGSATVEEWFYDPKRNPTVFYVSPPVATPCYVEVVTAAAPAKVTDAETNMELDDVYKSPVKDWMRREFYFRQTESQFALSKMRAAEQSFYQSLGIKYQAEKLVAPPVKPQEANA